jgi:hypothetical protein
VLMRASIAAGLGNQQQQRGPQPLAAAGDDVIGDPANQRDVRVQRFAQHLVDGLQVIAQRGLEQWDRHERRLGEADRVGRRRARGCRREARQRRPVVYPKPEADPATCSGFDIDGLRS